MSKPKGFEASLHYDEAQNKVEIDLYANMKRKPTAQELLDAFSELLLMHWEDGADAPPEENLDDAFDA